MRRWRQQCESSLNPVLHANAVMLLLAPLCCLWLRLWH